MAAKLAMAAGRVHPRDWVEILESHTPYEWRLQQARAIVDPWGEDRADLRAQINTSQIIAQQTEDESMRSRVADMVSKYYETDQHDENQIEVNKAALDALPEVDR